MADSASPGDERTVERWTLHVCEKCGRADTMGGWGGGCIDGPLHSPIEVEVVPVSHLPSEPSHEAVEAACRYTQPLWAQYRPEARANTRAELRKVLRAAYLKERELAERGTDRG